MTLPHSVSLQLLLGSRATALAFTGFATGWGCARGHQECAWAWALLQGGRQDLENPTEDASWHAWAVCRYSEEAEADRVEGGNPGRQSTTPGRWR